MSFDRDPLDPTYQPQPEVVPPGPPQYNGSNCCGFRCGWGCCEPSGGDGDGDGDGDSDGGSSVSGSEGATTLIGDPDQNELMERTPFPTNFVVRGTPRPEGIPIIGEIERGGLLILPNGFDRNQLHPQDSASAGSPLSRGYNDMNNSLLPEPSSGYMSGYVSTHNSGGRSMGIPSPMSPGLGYPGWHEEHLIHYPHLPPVYLFLRSPLWLSPQASQAEARPASSDDASGEDSIWEFLENVERLQAARSSHFF